MRGRLSWNRRQLVSAYRASVWLDRIKFVRHFARRNHFTSVRLRGSIAKMFYPEGDSFLTAMAGIMFGVCCGDTNGLFEF